MKTAAEALECLREGNRRFVADEANKGEVPGRSHRPGNVAVQEPFAIILACSDSRVPTELIFDRGIGDLFVIRVAGNVVAPSQIGSIEFAAGQFGTPLVVVLGHSNCGAIIATLNEMRLGEALRSPNLRAIVDRIRPGLEPVLSHDDDIGDAGVIGTCVRANVRASIERLKHGSLILEGLIERGELMVVGAEYSLLTGQIDFFEDD